MRHSDDFKAWANDHEALSTDIHTLLSRIMRGFKILVARAYDALWRTRGTERD